MPDLRDNLLNGIAETGEILSGVELPETIFGRRQAELIAALEAFNQEGRADALVEFG